MFVSVQSFAVADQAFYRAERSGKDRVGMPSAWSSVRLP
jgi:hypothetical protein